MDGDQALTPDQPFGAMGMPHGPICNIACEYCYYLEKTVYFPASESPSDYRMDEDVLEAYVKQYIEAFQGDPVTFAWQGGEPTLAGLDFFQRAIELQEKHAPPGTAVVNSLQTNGTLLDDAWGSFLADNDFLVGISIDGPRELHDAYRQRPTGNGSFDDVMDGLALLEKYDIEYNVLCTVHSANVDRPLEVYEFFRAEGIDWIQFIPIVEAEPAAECPNPQDQIRHDHEAEATGTQTHDWAKILSRKGAAHTDEQRQAVQERARQAEVSDATVNASAYGEFLLAIFDEWIRNDIGEVSVQIFDQAIQAWVGDGPDLCVFEETCGRSVIVEHNGDVYSCDHFVEPGFKLGNVNDEHLGALVSSPEQRQFGEYKRTGLPEYCRACDLQFVCNGGCPKNRLLETPGGESGLNYLCPGYEAFFSHVDPYMRLIEDTIEQGEPLVAVRKKVRALDEYYRDKE